MVNKVVINSLENEIRQYRSEAEEFLASIVAIPSISGKEGEVQDELYSIFSNLTGQTEQILMKESLRSDPKFASGVDEPFADRPQTRFLWEGEAKGRSLIACAHADVVGPGNWQEAFQPKIEGDHLYGRGAVDDKAAITSIFLAIKALQELNINLAGDLEVHLTNEEEVGMAGALAFVREGFKADGVLVLEPTDHNIYIAHRGCLQFQIEVEGKQSHLGKKRYGVSAIEKAAKIINALVEYEDCLIEEGQGYHLFESYQYPGQMNVGIIKGGDFFSTVPDTVTMEGGIGFLPYKTIDDVAGELQEVINSIDDPWIKEHSKILLNGLKNEPYQMPEEHIFTNTLTRTLNSLGRDPEILGMMASCDARYYYNQGGMPSIVYGGKNNDQSHTQGEHANIPDILDTALNYAAFILDWCGYVK